MAFVNHERAAVLLGSTFDIQAHIGAQLGFDLAANSNLPALTFLIVAVPLKNPGAVLGLAALDVQAFSAVQIS